MKKILLSCVTCLLALGLVTACDDEVEDVTPEDPNAGVVEPGGDDGEEEKGETTYLFGVEIDGVLSYATGATQSQGTYRGVLSADVSEAVAISCEQSESTYYLSFDNEGVTNWITIVSGDHTNLSYATEKSPIYLHTTDVGAEYFGDEDGENFLCYNKTYDCLYASSVDSYLESSPVAGLYTTDGKLVAGGIGEEPEPDPEPVGTMVEVETGVLGLYQGNKGNYYYFTGEINSSNFGVLSADYSLAAAVTVWKDEVYYYLTIGSESELKYISCPDTSATAVALISEPYCLQYDEEHDAWLTGNGKRFLATYSNYETMSWAETERYIDDESEFIAHIYNEEQKLPAPEAGSITISGATSVYVGSTITLTASVPSGYDSSVEWSIDNNGYATIEESSGLTCVVKGVSEGSATVTVKSTANEATYATATISIVPIPTGVTLLGSFDFSSRTSGNSTLINSSTGLDEYWTEDNSLFLGLRQYTQVYLGGGGSYAPSNSTGCIRLGTSSVEGLIEFKFALGASITEVVVTASGWGTNSGVEAATLTVNGASQACATSGTHETLTYSITDNWTNLVKMEATNRLTIQSIEIYGTYTSEFGSIGSLTLSAETSEVEAGEHIDVSVSWSDDVPFDIDTLTWASDNSEVATIEATYDGGRITGVAAGSTTITATAENGVKGEFAVTVTAVEIGDEYEVEVTAQYIIDHYMFDENTHFELGSGSSVKDQDPCTLATSNSPRTLDFYEVFSITWTGGDTATRLWTGNQIRMYNNGYFVISPESGWEITSISITDSNKKLTQYKFYTIASGDASTELTSETDYTITGSGEQFDTVDGFSTTDDFKVLHAGSGSSNNSTFTSIKIACTKTSV